jgi:5-oxopent-3-ene-1,2,5-tricarboxylate decarboxylase/2-hydroxyhepta-2,4-diene-1,7-dioate isomerase
MKHARIRFESQIHSVTVDADNIVHLTNGRSLSEDQVEWLPPANGTMFALGLNYADHAAELAFAPPTEPLVFVKSPGTYTGHNQITWRPDNVAYTLCNDYAIRDYLENYYRPNLRVKNRDATTPVGPWIVDVADVPDPGNLKLRTWINGELRQEGSTKDMIFDIPYLIEYLSSFMTLQPGDMIATGTPEGLADVVPGDEVIVEVEGVGRLVNRIVSEADFFSARKEA